MITQIKFKIKEFILFDLGSIYRKFIKKKLPNYDKVLINIGCGSEWDSRYINVDSRAGYHIDFIDSIENVKYIFKEDYADLIYVSHILEHVSHKDIEQTLKSLRFVLKPNGVLRISVPDFDKLLEIYKKDKSMKILVYILMGGQRDFSDYHKNVFNEKSLRELLLKSGFKKIKVWYPEDIKNYKFKDWASRHIKINNEYYPISLNLEARK